VGVDEAKIEDTPYGKYVVSDGWFVLNLGEALAVRNDVTGGAVFPIEGREARFPHFGVNVHVIQPGEPNCLYHSESGQEGFLVLSGECTLLVEEQERPLRQWDYFHAAPETRHVFVGSGDGPCAILMIGVRPKDEVLTYPVSELAARYGASVEEETHDPDVAYDGWGQGEMQPQRVAWPPDDS